MPKAVNTDKSLRVTQTIRSGDKLVITRQITTTDGKILKAGAIFYAHHATELGRETELVVINTSDHKVTIGIRVTDKEPRSGGMGMSGYLRWEPGPSHHWVIVPLNCLRLAE